MKTLSKHIIPALIITGAFLLVVFVATSKSKSPHDELKTESQIAVVDHSQVNLDSFSGSSQLQDLFGEKLAITLTLCE